MRKTNQLLPYYWLYINNYRYLYLLLYPFIVIIIIIIIHVLIHWSEVREDDNKILELLTFNRDFEINLNSEDIIIRRYISISLSDKFVIFKHFIFDFFRELFKHFYYYYYWVVFCKTILFQLTIIRFDSSVETKGCAQES